MTTMHLAHPASLQTNEGFLETNLTIRENQWQSVANYQDPAAASEECEASRSACC